MRTRKVKGLRKKWCGPAFCLAFDVIFVVLWFIGCSPSSKTDLHKNITPQSNHVQSGQRLLERYREWWNHPPSEDNIYMYGVGNSSASRQKAVEDARDGLIRSLKIMVEAKRKWKEVFTENDLAVDVVEYRVERYRATLPSTEPIDYHQEGNTYYALVRLKKSALDIQGKRDQSIVQKAYEKAQYLRDEGKILRSIEEYINAFSYSWLLLKETPFDRMDLQGNGQEVLASQQIERELKQLLGEIKLSKKGDEQEGYFSEALEEPLVVIATTKGRRVEGLPILFDYRSGRGKLDDGSGLAPLKRTGIMAKCVEIQTDRFGRAVLRVERIESISQQNEIVARINLLPVLDQLPEREKEGRALLRQIFEKRGSKEVVFHYKSFFMRTSGEALNVYLNGRSNHPAFRDGSIVTLKIETAQKGFLHIFHVNAEGKIRFKNVIEVKYIQRDGNPIIQKTPRGFEVRILGNKLVKRISEPESEAIVVIAASRRVSFVPNVPLKREVIIDKFKKAVPNWTIGQVSYEVQ